MPRTRSPVISQETKAQIICEARRPPPGSPQWSTRKMARAKGVSNHTVPQLWRAHDIKPHRKRTFKLSKDKAFEAKFWDVIGLCLDPPERALVLCCDEKSPCQALARTPPGLGAHPARPGSGRGACAHGHARLHPPRHPHLVGRPERSGRANSFGRLRRATRQGQWRAFLKKLDKETPADWTLHRVLDHDAPHKHPKVKSWSAWRNARQRKKPGGERLVLHFTPTSSSWRNWVERFFRDLSADGVRDGSFTRIKELAAAIESYLQERDLNPVRSVGRATGQDILTKIQRARLALSAA